MLPRTVFSCSLAAHAHACSVRALAISVIKLVGRQKHHHHPGQPVITCLLIKLTPNGIVLSFHFLIIIMTLSLFIGWHGSSKRGAWQLCRPRGRPSSLAQAWGCQVAFSKDHVNTMSVPCQYHVRTMSVPYQYHVKTMSVYTTADVRSNQCAYPEAFHADCMSGTFTISLGQCKHSIMLL